MVEKIGGEVRVASRRRGRRKPVRRALVRLHRVCSVVLGIGILVEALSGCALLYRAELYRSANPQLWHNTAAERPVGFAHALDSVRASRPGFAPTWVSLDHGVYVVGDEAYLRIATVDSGTGLVNGEGNLGEGFIGFLGNLHDCALSCEGEAGYTPWLATPIWQMKLGELLLGAVGLSLLVVTVSGAAIWWPGARRLARRFQIRWRRGGYARDSDLHNVIGFCAVLPLALWSFTGAAFFFPGLRDSLIAVMGGGSQAASDCALPEAARQSGVLEASADEAAEAARETTGGEVRWIKLPSQERGRFTVYLVKGYAPYGGRLLFSGDVGVDVAADDPRARCALAEACRPRRFYDQGVEAAHFGWLVDGRWRLLWLLFGLSPAALMITGMMMLRARRGAKRGRRKARALPARAPQKGE